MKRIQRKRERGWRMPPNTVYVGRPSRWENLYRMGETFLFADELWVKDPWTMGERPLANRADLVAAFRQGAELCTPVDGWLLAVPNFLADTNSGRNRRAGHGGVLDD